jgi:hypothetical protein
MAKDWSVYKLVQCLQGKVTDRIVYSFLAGQSDINSEDLGQILDKLELELKPKQK